MKRRIIVVLGLLLGLSTFVGSASSVTFSLRPTVTPVLPSATTPNLPGTVVVSALLTAPPAVPETRDLAQLQALWQSAGQAYGIPWQVLAAINKVESNFGRNMGPSSAGALGWMQFMPSTWERWGLDANGDGLANPWSPDDAVYAAARYLAASGGATDIRSAIFSYNHATWYVNEVLGIAALFGTSSSPTLGGPMVGGPTTSSVATFDRLQVSLTAAEQKVTAVNTRLVAALKVQRSHARVGARWAAQASAAPLLSDQLLADKQSVLAQVQADNAGVAVSRLQLELGAAEQELAAVRSQASTSSFAAASGTLLSAPSYSSGYVFPVGGGPSVVSVSHTHHDYPAADIAAPAGSPVYALADGSVERAWHYPDPRCGIGFTMRSNDGYVWTYCHLAYLEPSVQAGVTLTGGAPVGLVGSTGHATGPHLHLQLQPATQYPQAMPWFQSLADRAFRWQDAAQVQTPVQMPMQGQIPTQARSLASVAGPTTLHPVFAVVPPTAPAEPLIQFSR